MSLNRRDLLRTSGAAAAAAAVVSPETADAATPLRFAHEADVVIVGAGAAGITAAIVAREAGASVIVLEAEPHAGGHAMCSGGNVPHGGGTSIQKKYGIVDSPDLLFRDLTDWSVVESNGAANYRYNDHEIIRAFADHSAPTFEFLLAHGVVFVDKAPDNLGGLSVGASIPREMHCAPVDWPLIQTGAPAPPAQRLTTSSGNGLMQPLIAAARKAGVQILLEHRMTALHRPGGGRVTGVAATNKGVHLDIGARKAVIVATGGSTGNVEFRRMFDPRLTEEYCGLAGMPWSNQDASGELAGMAVGAALWGLANHTGEFGWTITKAGRIGCQYGYTNTTWEPGSPVFDRARASGLRVADWQNLIMVNMIGNRFYDEAGPQFAANNSDSQKNYVQNSWRNANEKPYKPNNFLNAALAGIGDGHNGGGPIWAIFDADGAAREKWTCEPPYVDYAEGFFFSAPTIGELASKIVMKHQRVPMPPAALERTVARYNGFVDAGKDTDFDKAAPKYKIARGPFYAAWATPVVHDTRAGLRINGRCQVVDMGGKVIPGLYCGGETAGGFSQHGLARATCQGFIAGHEAVGATVKRA
ncbi:MAG TPA: FAD-dependent oxidoreductase [Caulobacteraceae bacterium]|jgi:succinate dehydrogenase/fumarate reductase flavoprotein subunit|nr:FAD-dependent oxidoreductase [Caulobacteraceae bacterium]